MKRTKQQQRRHIALMEQRNRGLMQTAHKRSPIRGGMAQTRHCRLYLAAARRRGDLFPKARMAKELAEF